MSDIQEKIEASYNYHILSATKMEGKLGWWYRFWWKFLLGTKIQKIDKNK